MTQPLELTQQRFADALLDAACKPAFSDAVMASATQAPLSHRIALYRGNLWAHARGALAKRIRYCSRWSVTITSMRWRARTIGAHPSQSGDLNRFGRTLPELIERYETDARFRYFGDLARLEWALHGAYFAADATPFTQEQWYAFGHDTLLDARIGVHPACAALTSRYAVARIWQAHQPGWHVTVPVARVWGIRSGASILA
ncbi:HvfC/BufC family peptide modification chaperone [Paraburkholderia aromaticivorans]|uniref:HvfC/BufC family peptide modification chaperone n=1 Tax=Paraburkholderia aromaticivorans TaxID=2026199 RepID=UPI0038BC9710